MTNIMEFVLTHWEITLVPVTLDSLEMVSAAVVNEFSIMFFNMYAICHEFYRFQ